MVVAGQQENEAREVREATQAKGKAMKMTRTTIDNGLKLLKRNAAYVADEFYLDVAAELCLDSNLDSLATQLLQLRRDVDVLLNEIEELKQVV